MFGIRYSSGNIRPDNWHSELSMNTLDSFVKRNDYRQRVAVPNAYINKVE